MAKFIAIAAVMLGRLMAYSNFDVEVTNTEELVNVKAVEIDKNSGSIFINSDNRPEDAILPNKIRTAIITSNTQSAKLTSAYAELDSILYANTVNTVNYLAIFTRTTSLSPFKAEFKNMLINPDSLELLTQVLNSHDYNIQIFDVNSKLPADAAISLDLGISIIIVSRTSEQIYYTINDCSVARCTSSEQMTMNMRDGGMSEPRVITYVHANTPTPYIFAVAGLGTDTRFLFVLSTSSITDYYDLTNTDKSETVAMLSEPGKYLEAYKGATNGSPRNCIRVYDILFGLTVNSSAPTTTRQADIHPQTLITMVYLDNPSKNYLLVVFELSIRIYHKETLQEISQQTMDQFSQSSIATQTQLPMEPFPTTFASSVFFDTDSLTYWYAIRIGIARSSVTQRVHTLKFTSWLCSVPNCVACSKSDSLTKCDKCDAGSLMPYLVKDDVDMCAASIPAGYGPDTSAASPMTVHKCITANCADCSANKNLCTICKNGFVQNGAVCTTLTSTDLKLASAAYTTKNTVATLVFSHDLRPSTIRASLLITVRDLTAARVLPCDECSLAFKGRVLEVTVPLKEQVNNGVLVIEISGAGKVSGEAPLKSAQGQVFVDYPIEVNRLVLISGGASQAAKSTGETISAASSSIRAIANLAVSGANPGSAMALDKVLSEFFFLRFLEGPQIIYPTLVLTYASSPGSLPFSVGNPFADWAHNQVCPVPQVYAENDVSCNMLESYGEDVAINFAILMLTLSISLGFMFLCFKWKKPQTEDSPAELVDLDPEDREELPFIKRTIRGSGLNYGLKFFMAKIESTSLEICVYCAVTLTSDDYSTPMMAGKVVAGVVILLLATYSIFMVILGIKIKKQLEIYNKAKEAMEAKQSQENGDDEEKAADKKVDPKEASKKQQKIELGDVIRLDESKLWLFIAPFEEMAVPKRTWYLFAPVVTIIRNIALGFIVLKLNGKGYAQLSTISGIMLAHFCFTVTSNVKFSRYENIKEGLDLGFNFIYVTLKLASYSNISEYQRQTILGGIMAISLVLIIVNSIIYMVVLTIMAVVEFIKALRNFCKNKDGKMKKKSKKQGQKDQSIDKSQVESIMPMTDKNLIVQTPAPVVIPMEAQNLLRQKPIQRPINKVAPINTTKLQGHIKVIEEQPKEDSVDPTEDKSNSSNPRKLISHQVDDIKREDRQIHNEQHKFTENNANPNSSEKLISQKLILPTTQKKPFVLNNSNQTMSKKMQTRSPDPSQSAMEHQNQAVFSNLDPQRGLGDQYTDEYI